jgi:hypothetical protein
MKIPDKLKVGGHWYTVKYPYEFTERGDLMGQHDSDMLEIKISGKDPWYHVSRPESSIAVSFLHEILHACDRISGQHVFKDNEQAVGGISEILFQVLRDNKLRFDEEK